MNFIVYPVLAILGIWEDAGNRYACDTPNNHYPNGEVNFSNREFVAIRAV